MLTDPLYIVSIAARVLDKLGIDYLIGGSLASSVYGVPRATQDVDIVAWMQAADTKAFVSAVKDDYYVDEQMITTAFRRKASFNIVHFATMYKMDIFIAGDDPWLAQELARSRRLEIGVEGNPEMMLRFVSPEDIVLHKLKWYKLGDYISDRQWTDIIGVLTVQGDLLDIHYMKEWSVHLGVYELLIKALKQSAEI